MNKPMYDKYYKYLESVKPELIAAEETVKRITESKEFRRALYYFRVLYKRGVLKESPTKKNHYKIEKAENVFSLSDIADILTEDQIKQIKERAER